MRGKNALILARIQGPGWASDQGSGTHYPLRRRGDGSAHNCLTDEDLLLAPRPPPAAGLAFARPWTSARTHTCADKFVAL